MNGEHLLVLQSGSILMSYFYRHYCPDSEKVSEFAIGDSFVIKSNWALSFQTWGYSDIPFIVLLENGGESRLKLDLTRIIKYGADRYTLYLSKPTNKKALHILDKNLEWFPKINVDYLTRHRDIKTSIENNKKIYRGGYLLSEDQSLNAIACALIPIYDQIMK